MNVQLGCVHYGKPLEVLKGVKCGFNYFMDLIEKKKNMEV